jgi:hypothetical protein
LNLYAASPRFGACTAGLQYQETVANFNVTPDDPMYPCTNGTGTFKITHRRSYGTGETDILMLTAGDKTHAIKADESLMLRQLLKNRVTGLSPEMLNFLCQKLYELK